MEEQHMADDAANSTTPDGNNTSGDTSAAGEPKTITMTSQQLAERLARAKPADYDDVKAKAARLDDIEQANKSEIEKANERVAKAEAEAAKVPTLVADALREHLKGFHQIPDDKAELFLTASDPALLLRQAAALVGDQQEQRSKTRNVVPREGGTPSSTSGADPRREFLRTVMGRD